MVHGEALVLVGPVAAGRVVLAERLALPGRIHRRVDLDRAREPACARVDP